ncbi:hypothetical protein SAMN05216267_100945 [Actinacidiphila rubida]|uniref:Uncharacterized protein n=1 Tax=Actinacidiphila rubida TaxID=310780 RepID=A0A1H8IXN7_9ACTN|nr:hypothetical protein SAMN05216267_100945 [Actinacidiphila rubida]
MPRRPPAHQVLDTTGARPPGPDRAPLPSGRAVAAGGDGPRHGALPRAPHRTGAAPAVPPPSLPPLPSLPSAARACDLGREYGGWGAGGAAARACRGAIGPLGLGGTPPGPARRRR